jgi:hypothetical protein
VASAIRSPTSGPLPACGATKRYLQLSDVEWFAHEIHVRHAISKQRSRDGAHKWSGMGPPKSGNQSVIGATESVMRMLADLKMAARSGFYSQVMARLH